MEKSKRLKKALLAHHWHNLVKDNLSVDITELDNRLKPIAYLRDKLDRNRGRNTEQGNQLDIFGKEDP